MNLIRQLDERRAAEREANLQWARIVFPDGTSRLDCTILNISEAGAQIQFEPTAQIPKEFSLVIDPNMPRRPCASVWRIAGRMGVKFIEALSGNPLNGDWLFPVDDPRRPKEVRSPVLKHPLIIS